MIVVLSFFVELTSFLLRFLSFSSSAILFSMFNSFECSLSLPLQRQRKLSLFFAIYFRFNFGFNSVLSLVNTSFFITEVSIVFLCGYLVTSVPDPLRTRWFPHRHLLSYRVNFLCQLLFYFLFYISLHSKKLSFNVLVLHTYLRLFASFIFRLPVVS